MRKKKVFSTNGVGISRHPYAKKMKLNPYLTSKIINSKWIVGLNVNTKTVNPLEENIGENLVILD